MQSYGRGAEGGIFDVGRRTVQKSRRPTHDTNVQKNVSFAAANWLRSVPDHMDAEHTVLSSAVRSACLPGYCCVTM